MLDKVYIGVVIVLIIVILFTIRSNLCQANIYNQLINGFYEADPEFCKESGIESMNIFFDNDVSYDGSRACYLLMIKDGQFVLNEPLVARLSMTNAYNNWTTDPSKEKYFTIEFDGLSETDVDDDLFPSTQTIKFYPMTGKIIMYNDDIITAVLYKSGINTEIKDIVEDMNVEDMDVEDMDVEDMDVEDMDVDYN